MGKRVLVCGGRNYTDRDHIWNTLNDLDITEGLFSVVIHGCASGADSEAEIWAEAFRRKVCGFRAEWRKYGKAAGPIRNRRMLEKGKPDLVIAFPGGRGTADITQQAKDAGIKVIEIKTRRKRK